MERRIALDVVVTVPRNLWSQWIAEGDGPDEPWSGYDCHFFLNGHPPDILPSERVYIVAHGKLRGYAPLVKIERSCQLSLGRYCLLRRGGAVAVTMDHPITGFRGFKYRWWRWEDERPFPHWRSP